MVFVKMLVISETRLSRATLSEGELSGVTLLEAKLFERQSLKKFQSVDS